MISTGYLQFGQRVGIGRLSMVLELGQNPLMKSDHHQRPGKVITVIKILSILDIPLIFLLR